MILKSLVIGLMLFGSISNENGHIGVRVSNDGIVSKVHQCSPASYFIKVGDKIISADDHKGNKFIEGPAYTTVRVKVKRLNEILIFYIERIPVEDIQE